MSATLREECNCAEIKEEIWLCPHHRYRKGKREFLSVSKVIRTLLPTDYSAVDPVVLEIARLRGVFVDQYFCEWLTDPGNVVSLAEVEQMVAPQFPQENEKHAADTIKRIQKLIEWWGHSGLQAEATQKTVFSEDDGVAGTMDLLTAGFVLDLKCVSKLQPSYALQLGAYVGYQDQARNAAILHVTKDGVRFVKYDAQKCLDQWRDAVNWFWTARELSK